MIKVVRRIYDWGIGVAAHKNSIWVLMGISFAESSFLPIPPDILMIPMCIAKKERAFLYAGIVSLFSALGGLLGYAIGCFLFESLGSTILSLYNMKAEFAQFENYYNEYSEFIVFLGGFTPIPYIVITIASGVAKMNVATFFIVSIIARSLKFFTEAFLLWKFGAEIKTFIDKYFGMVTIVSTVVIFGGMFAIKYLL